MHISLQNSSTGRPLSLPIVSHPSPCIQGISVEEKPNEALLLEYFLLYRISVVTINVYHITQNA